MGVELFQTFKTSERKRTLKSLINVSGQTHFIQSGLSVNIKRPSDLSSVDLYVRNSSAQQVFISWTCSTWGSVTSTNHGDNISSSGESVIACLTGLKSGDGAHLTIRYHDGGSLTTLYREYTVTIRRDSSNQIAFDSVLTGYAAL